LRQSSDLMKEIIDLQCVKAVHWEKALTMASRKFGVSHIVDFGPGGLVGAASLTGRLKEGRGVAVIAVGSKHGDTRVLSEDALFSESEMKVAQNWEEFAPKLVKLSSGKFMLNTKFSRMTGKPPLMVAGMTPTTANEELVAAFTNSGYHGELAG
jgi:fatty acid synthase subunit alpha